MTYPNNSNNNENPLNERSYTGWIVTGSILIAVIFAIYMMSSRNHMQTAATDPSPAVTASPTSGSGSGSVDLRGDPVRPTHPAVTNAPGSAR